MDTRPDTTAGVAVWTRLLLVVGARAYRTTLLVLTVVAVAPLALGWAAFVVKSGSMEPSLAVGDVAVARPLEAADKVRVGRIFVFEDPAAEQQRTLVHRVVALRDDGDYTTAGDANELTDVTPLRRDQVDAQAILLVPWVGLPVTWLHARDWFRLALWLLLTVAAFAGARAHLDGDPPRSRLRRVLRSLRPGRPAPAPARELASAHRGAALSLAAGLTLVLVGATATAGATFTDRSVNGGSSWRAGQGLQPYVAQVLADAPFGLWLLDEPGGSWAADRSPHERTGHYQRIETHGLPGALPGNPGTSVATRRSRIILGPDQVTSPTTYSVELWFRTTSPATGYLAGFESSTLFLSGRADRILLIDEGHLVFGDWPAWVPRRISSPASYDDGRWHHVVVTSAAQQSVLYVDGVRVAAGETSAVDAYRGYWRVGGGSIGLFSGLLASFEGELDNVAVYPTALSEQRVAAHWAAR